ncbi:MAG: hypothetical protein ACJAZP_002425 [Psychromonas sp.]|jgi:hypothetical protein|uniref:hypothetical protein n=1 Tax=Psychromonas sp. TaxID=1884585 RepID=UPI0039E564B6
MLNKYSLAVALAAILTGCESSSSNRPTPALDSTTYTVIDGYLSAAEVYVISPTDNIKTLIGETDANGQIQISDEYKEYAVIAKIIAGHTTDSDHAGFVTKNYEMRGTANSVVVTPFTTLAYMNQISISELAVVLQLDEADVGGDYVKTADGKAYLVARTLATQFDADSSNDAADVDALQTLASDAASYIDSFLPVMGDDLNNIELKIDTNDHSLSYQLRVSSPTI